MPRSFIHTAKLNEYSPVRTLVSHAINRGLVTEQQFKAFPEKMTLNEALRQLSACGAFHPPAGLGFQGNTPSRVVPERFNVYGSLVDHRKNYLVELTTREKGVLFFASDSNLSGKYSQFFVAAADDPKFPMMWMRSLESPEMFSVRYKETYIVASYAYLSIY